MLLNTLLLAGTATATCLHGLSKFKRAEGEVEVNTFGYHGLIGPFNWASLAEENAPCKSGKVQSPINIDDTIQLATEKPILNIPEQQFVFENLATTIEVLANGTTSFGGSDFRLRQFHMHTPSEHRIAQEYYPLEIHMVHEGITNPAALVVIALVFQVSVEASAPIIAGLTPHFVDIANPGTKTDITKLDLSFLQAHIDASDVFQYTGSLTTPPCAEDVSFLLVKEPLPIGVSDFNTIKSIVKFNSRYTQNSLGEENMLFVGEMSGTDGALMPPPAAEPPAESNGTVAAAAMTKGQTITVTELGGQPTAVVAVVARKDRKMRG
ncbi:alpha carbonic anhydrase [Massariosphaeria phaeospora]|uniref:Carbonic anhydrase n=1 Tax=Massariosphaeria phaeospora TaxID=100035 RepID=A0A7C8I0D8_9PLEO|nr:alpha carbonic anhydrase [Massariosphaeria phaeospora]